MQMLLVAIYIIFNVGKLFGASHPDENLSITEYITKYNYPVEVHTLETPDGYILTAHRIPHGISNSSQIKGVALLTHGMGGNAENFLVLGPLKSLGFFLADRGYDVWLFNARGNVHSRKHRSLNPNVDRRKFWDFSWHEISVYDLPATINYILEKTKRDYLYYVGHSQGSTNIFVMLSEMPEINDKIKVAVLLAPAAHLNYTHSPLLSLIAKFWELGQRLLGMLNWYELVIPNSPTFNRIYKSLCKSGTMKNLCMDILYAIGGADSGLINKTQLPVILQYIPSGFSTKQAWHYAQVILSGEFKYYEYGKKGNLRRYNSTKPPMYNLSNVKIPIAFFYAKEDPFGNPKMIAELTKVVPNVIMNYEVPIEHFSHTDFLLANNIKEVINYPLYKIFTEYEEK